MTEIEWDKLLKIRTTGRDDSNADEYHYPYEPTPYSVLERLAMSGEISKKNTIIDYGAGKGRVSFFLSYQTKCHAIGIEFDEKLYQRLIQNQESAVSGKRCEFVLGAAEQYEVPADADRFVFFNPFSVEILQSVIGKIKASYYENMRPMRFYFYYPSDEYIAYLMSVPELTFYDEIDVHDLFSGENPRERILIFEVA